MSQQRRRRSSVRLRVSNAVELETGVILECGIYVGISERVGLLTMGGEKWAQPAYKIVLTTQQLEDMGKKNIPKNLLSMEYDVTEFVRHGHIDVIAY
jgi:hypothetical protein